MSAAAQLVGGYTVVGGEKNGQPIPQDRLYGTICRFKEDTVVVTDVKDQEQYSATYQVDESGPPWKIVMTATGAPNAGQVAHGLVEKTGNTVRLIYSLPGSPPPTGFGTQQGQLLFVMENQNTEGRPNQGTKTGQ